MSDDRPQPQRPMLAASIWAEPFPKRLRAGAEWAVIKLVQAVILLGGLFVVHRLLTFALVLMAQDAATIRQNANGSASYIVRAIEAGYLPKPIDDKGTLPPKPTVPKVEPSPVATPEPKK